jgi:hypothetical protein
VVNGDDDTAADGTVISLAAGSRIAGYRLEGRIGQGGMAAVFRARDEQLGRLVALKVLAPALAGDAEFRRRFTTESRRAAAIDDPHIVPVFAAGEADGMLFIAMRYVAGGDVQSLLNREGPLSPDRVVDIISPVASALDAAHRAGLVHRDVKPSNMLMDVVPGRPDHVYLSDFGLSKAVASTSGVTRAGMVLGTLAYISPEQIAGKPVDGRADQYALACSAFELLAGVPPFQRDEPAALMFAHLSESPPRLASCRPGLPPAVDGVLARGMAKAPGDRYASCGHFADALRDAFGIRPYHSGPLVRPMGTEPPTQIAGPATSPVSGTGDATATETGIPTGPEAITVPGELPVRSGGGQARPSRRRLRRRIAVAAVVVAALGLAAGLLPGILTGGPAPGPAGPTAVAISVKSAQPAVDGDVYVVYLDGEQANADVYGEVTKAANGEVAELYKQQFPYNNPPALVSSVTLHPVGTTARYEFQVTPSLATRYRVELFKSSTASTALATSGAATIYVSVIRYTTASTKICSRPVCNLTVQLVELVPPSALQTEISKPLYVYFGINLAPTVEPAPPQWLMLGAGNGHVSAPRRISAGEFGYTVTFSFPIGTDAFRSNWRLCAKNTEAADGIGLPGQHGCGDARILRTVSYLG